MSLCASALSFNLVRAGKLRPHKRFGAFPPVLFGSIVGYVIGKVVYLTSDWESKFLKDAPEGNIAYKTRKKRGLEQPWSADRSFNSAESEFVEDDTDKRIDSYDLYSRK